VLSVLATKVVLRVHFAVILNCEFTRSMEVFRSINELA